MKCQILITVIVLSLSHHARGTSLSLRKALELARTQPDFKQKYFSQSKAAVALGNRANGAFDTKLSFEYHNILDKGQLSSPSNGEDRTLYSRDLKVSKFLPTGTYIEAGASWEQQKVTYALAPDQVLNSIFTPSYNPEHRVQYGITVRQSLWKNFWARLVKLQQDQGISQAIQPTFQFEIEQQNRQGLVENYYWQLVALNQQKSIAKQLVKQSKSFVKAMKKRQSIGRADNVDVASAEAAFVQHEGLLLDIEIAQSQMESQLRHLLYGLNSRQVILVPGKLPKRSEIPLKYKNYRSALPVLKKQRIEILMIKRIIASLGSKIALAEESAKPQIDLFASYYKRGLGSNAGDSLKDLPNGDIQMVGLSIDWSIEHKAAKQDRQAANLEKQQWEGEEKIILNQSGRELDISFKNLEGTDRQLSLKKSQIDSLDRKKRAEEKKLKQARSDEVAVYRYDIEILMAQIEKVKAQARKMQQEARIRSILHDYPKTIAK